MIICLSALLPAAAAADICALRPDTCDNVLVAGRVTDSVLTVFSQKMNRGIDKASRAMDKMKEVNDILNKYIKTNGDEK